MAHKSAERAAARRHRAWLGLAIALSAQLALGCVAADAGAATGDLIQKPASAGCIAINDASGCTAATGLQGATSVAVSPDGTSVYVGAADSRAVLVLDRAADGTLTQKPGMAGCISGRPPRDGDACAYARGLDEAPTVTVSPDGRNVYVASSLGDSVAVFDRAAHGGLTQKLGAAGCIAGESARSCTAGRALSGASSVVVSRDGRSVYVASPNSGAVAVLDRAADGVLAQKPGAAGCISYDETSTCAAGSGLERVADVAVSPDGTSVYATSPERDAVLLFDRAADGTLTQKPGSEGCIADAADSPPCADGAALNDAASVATSPDGKHVYVASYFMGAVAVFDRVAGGALRQKRGADGCISDSAEAPCADGRALDRATSVTVTPDGKNVYTTAYFSSALAAFDRSAGGRLTQKPGSAGCISNSGEGSCVDGMALDRPSQVATSPDGTSVYVASVDGVAIFDREPIAPPRLSALSLSPSRFRAAAAGPGVVARGASRVSYRLSERATLRLAVQRAVTGRLVGRRCLATRPSNRDAQYCTRYATLRGALTHAGRKGRNAFGFSGRLGGRSLTRGRYRLRAVATGPAGNVSRPRMARFRITGG